MHQDGLTIHRDEGEKAKIYSVLIHTRKTSAAPLKFRRGSWNAEVNVEVRHSSRHVRVCSCICLHVCVCVSSSSSTRCRASWSSRNSPWWKSLSCAVRRQRSASWRPSWSMKGHRSNAWRWDNPLCLLNGKDMLCEAIIAKFDISFHIYQEVEAI